MTKPIVVTDAELKGFNQVMENPNMKITVTPEQYKAIESLACDCHDLITGFVDTLAFFVEAEPEEVEDSEEPEALKKEPPRQAPLSICMLAPGCYKDAGHSDKCTEGDGIPF